jgi:hypothetical protein
MHMRRMLVISFTEEHEPGHTSYREMTDDRGLFNEKGFAHELRNAIKAQPSLANGSPT